MRVVDALAARPDWSVHLSVIPGVTSASALTAAHGITANRIGEPVHITTGRRLPSTPEAVAGNQIVMLDGAEAFRAAARPVTDLLGRQPGHRRRGGDLRSRRAGRRRDQRCPRECKRRAGWVMDVYLLRSPDVVEGT